MRISIIIFFNNIKSNIERVKIIENKQLTKITYDNYLICY
jgi:hypothetical protein